MFTARQLENYADILLWGLKTARTETFSPGDLVMIQFDQSALRLAEIVYGKLLELGVHPVPRLLLTTAMEKAFYSRSNENQRRFIPPGEADLFRHLSGSIFLSAPESVTHLADVDPRHISQAVVARKHLRDILDAREKGGKFSWTLCMTPTEALARHAGLTLQEYTREVVAACLLDASDPVTEWETIYRHAAHIKDWLNAMPVARLHVESDTLDLNILPGEHRRWVGISGHNIPSFEIFLSPDWRGTEGVFYADQPSYRSGNYVKGVRLEFKGGTVTEASAEEGEAFLKQQLVMDEGASRIGEFSLTDNRFSRISKFMANTLFDENYGGAFGNCHIAVGASYADSYAGDPNELTRKEKERLGFNDSALHWDLVNTRNKRVTAHLKTGGRTVIYENGRFNCPMPA